LQRHAEDDEKKKKHHHGRHGASPTPHGPPKQRHARRHARPSERETLRPIEVGSKARRGKNNCCPASESRVGARSRVGCVCQTADA
jgi:hypothetical protein